MKTGPSVLLDISNFPTRGLSSREPLCQVKIGAGTPVHLASITTALPSFRTEDGWNFGASSLEALAVDRKWKILE